MCVKRWKLDEFQKKNMKKTRRGHRKKGMLFLNTFFFLYGFLGWFLLNHIFVPLGYFLVDIHIYTYMCRYAHVTLTFGRFTGKMMAFRLPA